MDTVVANHILNVYRVLHLLGIRVIFTGIRPDIAAAAVQIGVSFSAIESYSNVKIAFETIRS
ncbi:hypothetical protein CUU66_20185 [Peribacillus deserti]|uniref:STAS domain-containing protein n=1 Tax=Peribacillus deserti TaxID=673318 RepID=A0A2N5M167_9BACI|nr:hypothetical protein CUU66_20185 [Peribacillus deserti]